MKQAMSIPCLLAICTYTDLTVSSIADLCIDLYKSVDAEKTKREERIEQEISPLTIRYAFHITIST